VTETIRAIVEGFGFGIVTASLLTVYTQRALPRVQQMGGMERAGWVLFFASVVLGSLIAIESLTKTGWLQISDPNARLILVLVWLLPVAVVFVQGLRRMPPPPPMSHRSPPTVGALQVAIWVPQLVLFVLLVIAAAALWASSQ
jgi:hypothetical protein